MSSVPLDRIPDWELTEQFQYIANMMVRPMTEIPTSSLIAYFNSLPSEYRADLIKNMAFVADFTNHAHDSMNIASWTDNATAKLRKGLQKFGIPLV